jgi:hypothetical protein
MDATTIAITIDLVGWLGWFALTRRLTSGAAYQWITVDYYVSTTLLALSTLCTVAGAFFSQPEMFASVAVPAALLGLAILAWRTVRGGARTLRMQYTSDTQAAPAASRPRPAGGWQTVTAPPPASGQARRPAPATQRGTIFDDPLIKDIESRRMPA